jgi:ribosome-associated protein
MTADALARRVVAALEEMKALDVAVIDVRGQTSITDVMVIASGRSDRQVRALAERTVETAKKLKVPPLGTEGERQGEWILVDLGDVVVHLMHPTARAYYQLEKLWSEGKPRARSKAG